MLTGKSAGCPALPACGRQVGGEESRPCNRIYISRKPRPVGGELHFPWTQLQLPFNFKPVVAQLLDAHVANDASGFGKRSSLSW